MEFTRYGSSHEQQSQTCCSPDCSPVMGAVLNWGLAQTWKRDARIASQVALVAFANPWTFSLLWGQRKRSEPTESPGSAAGDRARLMHMVDALTDALSDALSGACSNDGASSRREVN